LTRSGSLLSKIRTELTLNTKPGTTAADDSQRDVASSPLRSYLSNAAKYTPVRRNSAIGSQVKKFRTGASRARSTIADRMTTYARPSPGHGMVIIERIG